MPQANREIRRSYARTARMHLRSKGSHCICRRQTGGLPGGVPREARMYLRSKGSYCICRRQIGGLPGEATRAARMHLRSKGRHCICRRQTGGLPGGAPREAQLLAKPRIPAFAAGKQGDSAELHAHSVKALALVHDEPNVSRSERPLAIQSPT
ncbi:hypothetical protein PV403_17750 [Paenibacillus sp. GYB006]|uniref:hypothetical protein n=1 Tax=Paenibacillus sp. GYB006 TaxID=2994394 RepID=UPI002F968826